MSISREQFKKKIKARRLAKQGKAKYARLAQIANEFPKEVSAAIGEMSEGFHQVGEALNSMNENLGLVAPPKSASIAVRIAASKNYGTALKRIVASDPGQLAGAINEVYGALNELAGDIENFADNIGIQLSAPAGDTLGAESPAEELAEGHETTEGPEFVEEELQEAEEAVEEGDMEEAAQESHDAEEAAEESAEEPAEESEPEEEPAEEVTASGADAWTTDRDENGQPKSPTTASRKASLLRAK